MGRTKLHTTGGPHMNLLNKVLVVDDSAQMHLAYKMILIRYRCDVIEALNGRDGLHKLTTTPTINLMIIDVNMPRMSGLEFVRKVKEVEDYKFIPIIVTSTAGKEADADSCLTLGANGCIKKPFTSSELHTLIETLFPAVRRP